MKKTENKIEGSLPKLQIMKKLRNPNQNNKNLWKTAFEPHHTKVTHPRAQYDF
jgi:hypothetical protein